jgi:signal transduction histidine kinase
VIPTGNAGPRLVYLSAIAGVVTTIIGCLVLMGWALHVGWLRTVLPSPIVMLPNTAVGFILAGLSVWLQRSPSLSLDPRRAREARIGRGLAVIVLLLGSLSFLERIFGWDFGIDRLLFVDEVAVYPYRPLGLMATNSTICFILAGAALLVTDRTVRRWVPAQVLATLGLTIASLALVGHLFNASPLYTFDQAAAMALITAVSFWTLHFGILFLRPTRGGVALLTDADLGGMLVRRLLPATILVPLVLGWLWLSARELEMISREGGIALFVLTTIAILFALVLRSAHSIRAVDRERQHLKETAEAASKAKTDFLAVMSHELRTPLNAIIGYGDLISDGVSGPVTETQQRQLARIKASANHLVGLISEILTLSRVDAGKEPPLLERVDVAKLLDEAGAMVAPAATEKHLDFRVHPLDDPLLIETDVGKVRQILVNLLSNAVKFTDAGGVEMRAVDAGADVLFRVRDTGIGISPKHVDRIFDDFWQVEQPMTRRATGPGLGLGISRRLAHLLGGTVTVESGIGEGSTFTVCIPKVWTRSAEAMPATSDAASGSGDNRSERAR